MRMYTIYYTQDFLFYNKIIKKLSLQHKNKLTK